MRAWYGLKTPQWWIDQRNPQRSGTCTRCKRLYDDHAKAGEFIDAINANRFWICMPIKTEEHVVPLEEKVE